MGERLALGYQFHIASSREQAIREAAPHYEENMKMFGELRLVRALTDEQICGDARSSKLAATTKLPRIEDAVKVGGFLAGRPEDIVEQLKAVEKRDTRRRSGDLCHAAGTRSMSSWKIWTGSRRKSCRRSAAQKVAAAAE